MYSLLLILAAVIWGGGFVAQSAGGDVIGPWTFNGVRYIIAGVALVLLLPLMTRTGLSRRPETKEKKKHLFLAGFLCGVALLLASSLQQLGITLGSSTGKAGFLTDCYIIMVPIIGTLLGRKCPWNVWISAVITLAGLYLLCVNGALTLSLSDILLILCALAFSGQILLIDHFSTDDAVRMACVQFLTVGVLSIPVIFFTEILPDPAAWVQSFAADGALTSLAYASLLSGCLAYTIQIISQQKLHPAVASLLMSLESIFSLIFGWLLLGDRLSGRELTGCGLMFAAVIFAQIPFKSVRKAEENANV